MPRKPAGAGEGQEPTWEQTHQRVTFHCPTWLLVRIKAEVARSGRSKSRVIADAVQAALGDRS